MIGIKRSTWVTLGHLRALVRACDAEQIPDAALPTFTAYSKSAVYADEYLSVGAVTVRHHSDAVNSNTPLDQS